MATIQAFTALKKLRILIRHAKDDLKWIASDPSEGIKRGKSEEIRAWTDSELKAFEDRWAFGTKQRAAYELMLNAGTARIDTHLTTWVQADADDFEYMPSPHFLGSTFVF